METKPTIRELIDACRADHDDPQRPELAEEMAALARELAAQPRLAETMERSERFDRNVRAALDDVTLPAGLADRLLAKCAAATGSLAPGEMAPAEEAKVAADARATKLSRRRVLAILSTAASLLILVVGGWTAANWLIKARRPVTNAELATRALDWFDRCGPGAEWQPVDQAATSTFPWDRSVTVAPVQWRIVEAGTGVYDLTQRGQRALLFVHRAERRHPGLGSIPFRKLSASGGLSMGAWKRGAVVYVLVVVGDERALHRFVVEPEVT